MTTSALTKNGPADANMKLATAVSRLVDVHEIKLVSCNVRYSGAPQEGEMKLNMKLKAVPKLDGAGKTLGVNAHFLLTDDGGGSKGTPDLFIEAHFLLVYKLTSATGLEPENLQAFADLNGRFNAWPYWREFVQTMTTRMGLPALTVPSLKITGAEKPGSATADTN